MFGMSRARDTGNLSVGLAVRESNLSPVKLAEPLWVSTKNIPLYSIHWTISFSYSIFNIVADFRPQKSFKNKTTEW